MNYKKIISRLLDQNIYILSNDKNEAIIIDPGLGFDLIDSIQKAKLFVEKSLENSYKIGSGPGPLGHH